MTPSDAKGKKEEYLVALMKAMLKEDEELPGTNGSLPPNYTENFIRVLPSLSEAYTNPVALNLKAEFAKQIADNTLDRFYTILKHAPLPNCFASPRSSSFVVLPVHVTAAGKQHASRWYETRRRATSEFHVTCKFRVQTLL